MKNLIAIGFLVLSFFNLKAQEIVSNSGNNFSNEELQISWTLGEPVIGTYTTPNCQLTQGFHQTVLLVTSLNELPKIQYSISAYPNPTASFLNLKIEGKNNTELQYLLYNAGGKLLMKNYILNDITEIPMINYAPSTYYLKIQEKNLSVKTFKIIKK